MRLPEAEVFRRLEASLIVCIQLETYALNQFIKKTSPFLGISTPELHGNLLELSRSVGVKSASQSDGEGDLRWTEPVFPEAS